MLQVSSIVNPSVVITRSDEQLLLLFCGPLDDEVRDNEWRTSSSRSWNNEADKEPHADEEEWKQRPKLLDGKFE